GRRGSERAPDETRCYNAEVASEGVEEIKHGEHSDQTAATRFSGASAGERPAAGGGRPPRPEDLPRAVRGHAGGFPGRVSWRDRLHAVAAQTSPWPDAWSRHALAGVLSRRHPRHRSV